MTARSHLFGHLFLQFAIRIHQFEHLSLQQLQYIIEAKPAMNLIKIHSHSWNPSFTTPAEPYPLRLPSVLIHTLAAGSSILNSLSILVLPVTHSQLNYSIYTYLVNLLALQFFMHLLLFVSDDRAAG